MESIKFKPEPARNELLHHSRKTEKTKMAQTLKEAAGTYIPPKTLNIADLNKVQVDVELKDGEGTRNNGEKFQYKYVVVEGQEYRVPGTVIGGIKAILKELPNTKFVKVLKEGEGKTGTKYQVIPVV